MIKLVVTLLVAGLLLCACGTQSESKAMDSWATQSDFHANMKTLIADVRHTATALDEPSSSVRVLHLVCDVLDFDASAANSALPTPDAQSTSLLSRAYDDIDGGAHTCFRAGANAVLRRKALDYLQKGLGELNEAMLRVDVAAGRSSP